MLKISFGIIVLNGDFFLRQVIESIYPYAHSICVAEGSVKYWREQGIETSQDETNLILHTFPDPDNKLKIVHGTWDEKTEQCQAWFKLVPEDTDYVFCVDSDEVHSAENIEKLIKFLEKEQPTSVGFKSDSFYGGFDRIIGGFEREHSFKRVLQYKKGCIYRTHRQPTLSLNGIDIEGKDISGNQLHSATGITMWHGSYVSPKGVKDKIQYYENAVITQGNCIANYFENVYLNWVLNPHKRQQIEQTYKGVQEFNPQTRGEAFTMPFSGNHPDIIKRDMVHLIQKFEIQLEKILNSKKIEDKNTCWHKINSIKKMNEFYDENVKGKYINQQMEEFYHLKILNENICKVEEKNLNILDIGCGTAFISDFFKEHNYTGSDLPNVLAFSSIKYYPHLEYICVDIINGNIDIISKYDMIVLNGVIDVMQYPIEIFSKILQKAKKYVLLHRQEISKKNKTYTIQNGSYGGYTYHSIFNRKDFENILESNDFEIVSEKKLKFNNWEDGGCSFLLKKKDKMLKKQKIMCENKLSVCLTTYNRPEMSISAIKDVITRREIDSVIYQDDCSEINNFNKFKLYAQELNDKTDKIHIFRNNENIGMSRNKVESIKNSKTPFCILFDDDNTLTDEYINAIRNIDLQDHIIYCPEFAMPKFNYSQFSNIIINKLNVNKFIEIDMFACFLNTCNYVVNVKNYLKVYEYNPQMKATDTLWFNYLWLKSGGNFLIVPAMNYHHRMHDDSGWIQDEKYNAQKAAEIRNLIRNL